MVGDVVCSPRAHSVLLHARRRLTPRWPTRARAALAVALSASTQDDRNHRALARMAGRGAAYHPIRTGWCPRPDRMVWYVYAYGYMVAYR